MQKKILIVDDEAHLRMLIHQALEELEDEGVELMTATNGDEAVAAIVRGLGLGPAVPPSGISDGAIEGGAAANE